MKAYSGLKSLGQLSSVGLLSAKVEVLISIFSVFILSFKFLDAALGLFGIRPEFQCLAVVGKSGIIHALTLTVLAHQGVFGCKALQKIGAPSGCLTQLTVLFAKMEQLVDFEADIIRLIEKETKLKHKIIGEIQELQKKLGAGLLSMLGIKAKVSLVAPKTIERSEGKAVRVIDNRNI